MVVLIPHYLGRSPGLGSPDPASQENQVLHLHFSSLREHLRILSSLSPLVHLKYPPGDQKIIKRLAEIGDRKTRTGEESSWAAKITVYILPSQTYLKWSG